MTNLDPRTYIEGCPMQAVTGVADVRHAPPQSKQTISPR